MASRFPTIKVVDKCFSPITIYRNETSYVVPCGRCAACQLSKANDWSMRLRDEIEATPFTLFGTLTYNNKYCPKLRVIVDSLGQCYLSPKCTDNIRFDGSKDVPRDEDFLIPVSDPSTLPYVKGTDFVSYASKRDIQLWLKLIRKSIFVYFNLDGLTEFERKEFFFRYYIISEYGPLTRRGHYHFLMLFKNKEVSEYVLRVSAFQNWQMCNEALFMEHFHYCDSGAAEYVTNYVTCNNSLSSPFNDKNIRPFRLASKGPSIGFVSFDREEIFESLFRGVNEYSKRIARTETQYIFCYPAKYMRRLFPKCREFSLLSPSRLYSVYSRIYRYVRERGFIPSVVFGFLRSRLFAADYTAALACWRYCESHNYCSPHNYLYLLDMYYYKEAMFALSSFYRWQEEVSLNGDFTSIIFSYGNFSSLAHSYNVLDDVKRFTIDMFLGSFGVDAFEYCATLKDSDLIRLTENMRLYRLEVEQIISDSVKLPKFNEKFGFAPHSI